MGSKGSSTTTQSFQLPKEFRDAYKKSIDMATQATSSPYQAYTGQLVAGFTPSQQQGLANINAAQGMALPAISQGMDLTRRAAQGITPELYQQFYSPYTRDVANTTMANLMESSGQQRSGLKSGAIQAGAFGGDRGGIAQAEMARQQNLALGQTMGNIYNQGYGQAMQLAGQQAQNYGAMGQQLAGLGVGAQGSVLQGAQAQMAAGAQQQATDQAQLQAAYEQWMQRQAYPYQQAQFFANIAQGLGAGAGGTSSTTTPGPSWGSQALGAIGAIGSIASMSDKRVKENIEAVGTLNDGQTIYRYNFKGDPKTQIGLLAQEVETREPGAVTDVKGLKMVDYKGATDKAASMGGLVTPDMQREAFAAGGTGGPSFYPYASLGYVPEGKIQSGGNRIPDMGRAPPPFEDKGLAEDWQSIKPLTDEQVGGLKALVAKMGLSPSEESEIFKDLGDVEYGADNEDYARGGLVARHGYALDGAVEEEAGLAAAPEPMADEDAGLAAAEEKPRSRFDIGRLFASEENPSIIETVMGRRLSPAARAAVMNASFAMMAGRSPFMGVNIGEAGKVGAQTYYNALAQERELAKQKADIGRQAYEAQTGRISATQPLIAALNDVNRRIGIWAANPKNKGQPLPEYFTRQLEMLEKAGLGTTLTGTVSAPSGGQPAPITIQGDEGVSLGEETAPLPATTGEIQETDTQEVANEIPAPPAVAEDPSSGEAKNFFDELYGPTSNQNPFFLDELASNLNEQGYTEEARAASDKAAAIRQGILENGVVMDPKGVTITAPGVAESQAQLERSKKAAATDQEFVTDIYKTYSVEPQKSYAQTLQNLNKASEILENFETGSLAGLKANFAGVMSAIGVPVSQDQLNDASNYQQFVKLITGNLLNSGLRQNLGQVALGELQIAQQTTASAENQPSANRAIIGVQAGILDWQNDRGKAVRQYIQQNGGAAKVDPTELQDFIAEWDAELSKYVEDRLANTPVKGEINFSDPKSRKNAKPGWKYVLPNGEIAVYDGTKFIGVE